MACKHTACRYCGLDIEGFWPYRKGEWRDRGNNTHYNDMLKFEEGDLAHAPVKECADCGRISAQKGLPGHYSGCPKLGH